MPDRACLALPMRTSDASPSGGSPIMSYISSCPIGLRFSPSHITGGVRDTGSVAFLIDESASHLTAGRSAAAR